MGYRARCSHSTDGQRSVASFNLWRQTLNLCESKTRRVSITTMVEIRESLHRASTNLASPWFYTTLCCCHGRATRGHSLVGLGKYLGLTRMQFSWCRPCGQGTANFRALRLPSTHFHCPVAIVDVCETSSGTRGISCSPKRPPNHTYETANRISLSAARETRKSGL